ncbi:MAG: hypothetical protein QXQ79_00110 [Candidatus Nanoarchaeia archaeon]
MSRVEAIYKLVSQSPVLPIEVATALSIDSFTAKAVLDFLTESGKIKCTSEKIGGVPIYYLPGQELSAQTKLNSLLSVKPTVGNFSTEPVQITPEIERKRKEFLEKLKEIERREKEEKSAPQKQTSVEPIEHLEEVEKKILTETKEFEKSENQKIKISTPQIKNIEKVESDNLIDLALKWLESKNAVVTNKELRKKGREAILEFLLPSAIGNIPFIAFILNKKTINELDISLAHSESIKRSKSVLIISKGNLTKKAKLAIEEFNGLIKFEKLN